jgi:phytoene desaturase
LKLFLEQAAYKYKVGMGEYVFRPSHSITEFIDFNLIRKKLQHAIAHQHEQPCAQVF